MLQLAIAIVLDVRPLKRFAPVMSYLINLNHCQNEPLSDLAFGVIARLFVQATAQNRPRH